LRKPEGHASEKRKAKTTVTYKTMYNVYVNCHMKCSIRQGKEDPEQTGFREALRGLT
jgi:hypothetical protein